MQTIQININQAKITGFSVDLSKETPRIMVSIDLLAGDKKITSFSIESADWLGKVKFDVSPAMVGSIIDIGKELEQIVVAECQRQVNLLDGGASVL